MEKLENIKPRELEQARSKVEPFDRHASKYEAWFTRNKYAYLSELSALRMMLPRDGLSVEIGVGSGRFAKPLGITIGIEPSSSMMNIAHERGIDVIDGIAESLAIASSKFDNALMVTTICFLTDIEASLREAFRILKPTGQLVIGFVDRESFLGRTYEERRHRNVFYSVAKFYSTKELVHHLKAVGFGSFKFRQTIFHELRRIRKVEPIKDGYGEGAFVVIAASKNL